MRVRVPLSLLPSALLVAGLAFLLCACGEEEGPSVDKGDPTSVAKHFLTLFARGELEEARQWMTQNGYGQVRRELRLFQKEMEDPKTGPPRRDAMAKELEKRGATLEVGRWEAVARGNDAGVLQLLLDAYPMPDPPRLQGFQAGGGKTTNKARFFFAGAKRQNFLLMVRDRGEWRVEGLSFP